MSDLRYLLYIFSAILFTLFVGILVVSSVVLYSNPIVPSAVVLDRVSVYSIIVLLIVGALLFFNLRRLYKFRKELDTKTLEDRLKVVETTTPPLDERLRKLETTPPLDERLKGIEESTPTLNERLGNLERVSLNFRLDTLENLNIEERLDKLEEKNKET